MEGCLCITEGDDADDRAFQILEDDRRGNPQNGKPTRSQKSILAIVAFRSVTELVGSTIDFDGNAAFEANEINNDFAQRMLPTKLVATGSFAQFTPDQDFGQIPGATFAPGQAERLIAGGQHPSTTRLRRAVPLPVPGRCPGSAVDHPHHIRNTPKAGLSGIGASRLAASARPSTSRVWAGSITPSSHSRAVA